MKQRILAFQPLQDTDTELPVGGSYAWRVRGEYHLVNPSTVSKMQHAVRQNSFQTFQEYTDLIDRESDEHFCRCCAAFFRFKESTPIPLDEVTEPATERNRQTLLPLARCRSAPSRKKPTKPSPSP